jgi:hypothetical protein
MCAGGGVRRTNFYGKTFYSGITLKRVKRPTHVTICRTTGRTTHLLDYRSNSRPAVLPPHVPVKSFRF